MCVAALSRDRTALSGEFVEDELKAEQELEFRNMLHWMSCFKEKHGYEMVSVDEWRGDRGHDFVCVSSSPRGAEMICSRELQTLFFKHLLANASSLHIRTDEEIHVKVPSGIKILATQGSCVGKEKNHQSIGKSSNTTSF